MTARDCNECPLVGRREFLRDASLAVAGIAATLGASHRAFAELPVHFTSAMAATSTTRAYAVPSADSVQIDKSNEVILMRWQNAVYAFNLSCPHQNTALRWDDRSKRFQCPKHHSRYEPDGTFIDGRATRGMDRFTVSRDGTNIVVDITAMHKQDSDPAAWGAAVVHLS